MHTLTSWRALFVREYLEHRMAFVYFPLGIVVLLALSALSALGFNRVKILHNFAFPDPLKVFELGYLVLLAMWLVYLAIALFFYYGDAFAADRRNNAMLFWKSMPVTDLKVLASKYFAGSLMFPTIILLVGMVTGLLFFAMVSIGAYIVPGFAMVDPLAALGSFVQITLFGLVYFVLALVWYAPFLAWVGGLSTVVGRWSLPLAFVIPGLLIVIENVALFGNVPRGGYIWAYIGRRFNFGLDENDLKLLVFDPRGFDAWRTLNRVVVDIDWLQMGIGVLFAALVIWLASQYRRRRIV
ncbi:MAG: hypothetical protein ABIQ30_03420 [Devosia sp.]